jgi:hypothetical protein
MLCAAKSNHDFGSRHAVELTFLTPDYARSEAGHHLDHQWGMHSAGKYGLWRTDYCTESLSLNAGRRDSLELENRRDQRRAMRSDI